MKIFSDIAPGAVYTLPYLARVIQPVGPPRDKIANIDSTRGKKYIYNIQTVLDRNM